MSKYTTELRFYCETLAGYSESQDYDKIDSIVSKAAPKIFSSFPIWSESYRLVLETKILKHYYVREICAETPGLWKLWLNNRMNEIMPYYNDLYKSAEMEFNPFHDVDITRDHTGEDSKSRTYSDTTTNQLDTDESHTDKSESKTSGSDEVDTTSDKNGETNYQHLDKYSNTPQGGIDGPIFSDYLTDARDVRDQTTMDENVTSNSKGVSDSQTDQSSNGSVTVGSRGEGSKNAEESIDSTDKFIEHIYGKQGTQSYSSMILEYRETLLNIDMMIIEALSDLFFRLY